ncbi:MAG: class II fructose-bisphosphate aldolase [Armatimonadota bacterium]
MALIPMKDMLAEALAGKYAVGYFEAWDQYSYEAVLEAAEELKSPVILGFGGSMMNQKWFDNNGLRGLAAMGRAIAGNANVPVSFLLNEVLTYGQIISGLTWGFNAVMLDTSDLPFEENIAQTQRVVDAAHAIGVDVEGECDRLPDASGAMGSGHSSLTDPNSALRYVEETGVDSLSVSIGNVHILTEGQATIDFELLTKLRDIVPVPLVVHGGTGFPDDAVRRAIELGVAKFNIGTIMKKVYLEAIREEVAKLPEKADVQAIVGSRKSGDFLETAKFRVKEEVKRRMLVYGSEGKA